jgi:hypothetical protein
MLNASSLFDLTIEFSCSNTLLATIDFIGSNLYDPSGSFAASFPLVRSTHFNASALLTQSFVLNRSPIVAATLDFKDSSAFDPTFQVDHSAFFALSEPWKETLLIGSFGLDDASSIVASELFRPSAALGQTPPPSNTQSFSPSSVFWASLISQPSSPLIYSPLYPPSANLAPTVSLRGVAINGDSSQEDPWLTPAALAAGGGLTGLAALGGLALFLLLKKKKRQTVETIPDDADTITSTIDEPENFVSEYGLSDAYISESMDSDAPRTLSTVESDEAFESENNPDEFS